VSNPSLIAHRHERDPEGNLLPKHFAEIRRVLQDQGFVVLPSDTAYSVAAWPRTSQTRTQINEMLQRANEPLSLAFPSVTVVRQWTTPNAVADRLLECFTPGPITVVRSASRLIPADFTRELIGSQNHTIGVRITDSAEERQVAGAGASPVTTVPVQYVRADGRSPVTSFPDALAIFRKRIAAIDGAPRWCAIEGTIQYSVTSTVVEILGESGSYNIKREGVIPEADIHACAAGRRRDGGPEGEPAHDG
jgi:tRNA A37 threonylcarbamoyladenosine synthetase subunit TsaC/SUA5/YrdC